MSLSLLTLLLACDNAPPPTWHADVSPIVQTHCAGCHTEGGAGGFSMDTLETMTPVAGQALDAIEDRRMPPWMPDPDCGEFKDERRMSEVEIATFAAWVDAGLPEGDPADAVTLTPEDAATITPTHTASAPGYTPDPDAGDDYRCFILDIDLPETRYLLAAQVVPDSGLVHHVLVYALGPADVPALEAADAAEEGPGYTCFGGPLPQEDSGMTATGSFPNQLAAWVPGSEPARSPEGTAIRIVGGSKVVMQVHYSALGGEPEPDESTLQLELTDVAPDFLRVTRPLPIRDLDIPAGAQVDFTAAYPFYGSQPVVIRSLGPHMHLLGQSFAAAVERTDGEEECALEIPEWDFSWQQSYLRPEDNPLLVYDGDRMRVTCAYDNSAENQPIVDGEQIDPRDVAWGDGTLDEMCLLYLDMIEPFTPEPAPDALPCDGADACRAACEDPDSLDCVASCEDIAPECMTCSVRGVMECGGASCAAALLPAQECLQSCLLSTFMLGSNFGACMEAECGEDYEAVLDCVDPLMVSEDCAEPLAACGL